MVNRRKSVLFFAACLIVSLICSAFAIVAAPVRADEENTTPTFETYATTVNGASVKKTEGNTGLRFRWTMTETQYNAFQNSEDTVIYGMIIAPLSYNTENQINAESVFGANAVYSGTAEEGKTQIINLSGTELKLDDESGLYCFNGAITQLNENNYTRKFIGVGYISVQKQGEEAPTYYFAKNENCVAAARTVVYVSEIAKQNGDDSTVLDGFISTGYENLGLNVDTIDSNELYTSLENAISNGVMTGFDKNYTLTTDVDESKYVYAEERMPNVTFTYPHYDNVIEDFNNATSRSAAYGGADGTGNKNTQLTTAEWLADYQGRYGVLKLGRAEYYFAKDKEGNPVPEKHANVYKLKSSFREKSFYNDNSSWDYISIWMYVVGSENETVKVGLSQYIDDATQQTVDCNKWVEVKFNKAQLYSLSGGNNADGTPLQNQLSLSAWLSKTPPAVNGKVGDKTYYDSTFNAFLGIANTDSEKDIIIYVDSISYESDVKLTVTGDAKQNSEVTLSASYGDISDFTYSVKKPDGSTANLDSNKFTLTDGGVYTFEATATVYGVVRTAETQVVVHADNEIEGFHTADSVVAAYGKNKNIQLEGAEWLETFEGRNGVIKLGRWEYFSGAYVEGSTEVYEYTPKNLYNIKSSFRDNTFYTNNEEWDYISIWIYVAGEDNETVKVGLTKYGNYSTTVTCNTWTEVKFEKENTLFLSEGKDASGVYMRNQTSLSAWLAKTAPTETGEGVNSKGETVSYYDSSFNSFLSVELNGYADNDRTVYIDNISYEKNVEVAE